MERVKPVVKKAMTDERGKAKGGLEGKPYATLLITGNQARHLS